jgi:hypothetical protein
MVNPPWVFSAFWKIVSPFLDPVTSNKIVFVKNKTKDAALILEQVESDQLEKDFGGSNEFKFDYALWKEDQQRLLAEANAKFETFLQMSQ